MEKGGNKGQELLAVCLFCKKKFTAWLWGGNSSRCSYMLLKSYKSQTPPLIYAQMKRVHLGDVVFKTFGLCIV